MGNQAIGKRGVIIGRGITGTRTVRELALNGRSVKVQGASHVGAESRCRTAAGICQPLSTPVSARGMRHPVGFYKEFAKKVEGGQSPKDQSRFPCLFDDQPGWQNANAEKMVI